MRTFFDKLRGGDSLPPRPVPALAVAVAIAMMQLTRTVHPPAGAN